MDYKKQAQDFLDKNNLELTINRAALQSAPIWAHDGEHGIKYRVTITSQRGAYTFDFWDSIANKDNHAKPDAYDVLACLSVYDGTIDDFVDDFGYGDGKVSDVIKTYNSVVEQSSNLKHILTTSQLEELEAIA